MKPLLYIIISIATTAVCWGIYGPVLHWGQAAMGSGKWRPFMCVGIAYFAIAIVVPLIVLNALNLESGKEYQWTMKGAIWSLAAGAAGAFGALGIIMALNFGGDPRYVMPLVFGFAPVINTLWTGYWNKQWNQMNAPFLAGLILVVVGAVVVLIFQPRKAPVKTAVKPSAEQVSAYASGQDPLTESVSRSS